MFMNRWLSFYWSEVIIDWTIYCDWFGEFLISPGTLCSFMCGPYLVIGYDVLGSTPKNGSALSKVLILETFSTIFSFFFSFLNYTYRHLLYFSKLSCHFPSSVTTEFINIISWLVVLAYLCCITK